MNVVSRKIYLTVTCIMDGLKEILKSERVGKVVTAIITL